MLPHALKAYFKLFCLIFNRFTPPGAMSAGLTCPLFVTFEPKVSFCQLPLFFVRYELTKVNEDITGSIDFMSQTGPFSIKVMCLTKKCMVKYMYMYTCT